MAQQPFFFTLHVKIFNLNMRLVELCHSTGLAEAVIAHWHMPTSQTSQPDITIHTSANTVILWDDVIRKVWDGEKQEVRSPRAQCQLSLKCGITFAKSQQTGQWAHTCTEQTPMPSLKLNQKHKVSFGQSLNTLINYIWCGIVLVASNVSPVKCSQSNIFCSL